MFRVAIELHQYGSYSQRTFKVYKYHNIIDNIVL